MTEQTTNPAADVEHMFQPFVCVLRRPDGNYTMDLDWSDSYLGENTEDGWDDRGTGAAAQAAVDAWRKTQPATLTIPPAPSTADAADAEAIRAAAVMFLMGEDYPQPTKDLARLADALGIDRADVEALAEPEPELIATFDMRDEFDSAKPPTGIPDTAWPHVRSAAATGRVTGSIGARTTDPATGIGYRIEFRRTVSDDAWKVESTTPVADVYLWSGE